jgi:hypothetical protein
MKSARPAGSSRSPSSTGRTQIAPVFVWYAAYPGRQRASAGTAVGATAGVWRLATGERLGVALRQPDSKDSDAEISRMRGTLNGNSDDNGNHGVCRNCHAVSVRG